MKQFIQTIFYLVLISLKLVNSEENKTDVINQPSINLNKQTNENVTTGRELDKIEEQFVINVVNDWESKLVNDTQEDLTNHSDLKINLTNSQNEWKTSNSSKKIRKKKKKLIVIKKLRTTTPKPSELFSQDLKNDLLDESGWKPIIHGVVIAANSNISSTVDNVAVPTSNSEGDGILTKVNLKNSQDQWKTWNISQLNKKKRKRAFPVKKQLSTPVPMIEHLFKATTHLQNHIVENNNNGWKPITGLLRAPTTSENTTVRVPDSLKIESNWASSFVQSAHHQTSQIHQPSYSITEADAIPVPKEKIVKYPVFVRVNQPYPVQVKVPHPYPIEVNVPVPYQVQVPQPYPVIKNVPYYVKQLVYVAKPYPVEKLVGYPVKVPVEKLVPHPVYKPYPVKVYKNVYVPYIVKKPYPVKIYVEKKIPVHVEKKVPYPVKIPYPVPYPVVKKIPYTVYKKVPYPVKVPVDNPVPYEVIKLIPVPIKKEKSYHHNHHSPLITYEEHY